MRGTTAIRSGRETAGMKPRESKKSFLFGTTNIRGGSPLQCETLGTVGDIEKAPDFLGHSLTRQL